MALPFDIASLSSCASCLHSSATVVSADKPASHALSNWSGKHQPVCNAPQVRQGSWNELRSFQPVLVGGRTEKTMSVLHDEVEIEDMEYDEDEETYFYPCPCGDRFQITKEELENGEDIARCPSCSLMIRVIYDLVC
ncbi:Diphthamide biosynthesis protein 3 [Sparganum proliferum]